MSCIYVDAKGVAATSKTRSGLNPPRVPGENASAGNSQSRTGRPLFRTKYEALSTAIGTLALIATVGVPIAVVLIEKTPSRAAQVIAPSPIRSPPDKQSKVSRVAVAPTPPAARTVKVRSDDIIYDLAPQEDYDLAQSYDLGTGTHHNPWKARKYYLMAIKGHVPGAARDLANMYFNGDLGKPNYVAANTYYAKDLAQHDTTAELYYGENLIEGLGWDAPDKVTGCAWVKAAADQKDEDAAKEFEKNCKS